MPRRNYHPRKGRHRPEDRRHRIDPRDINWDRPLPADEQTDDATASASALVTNRGLER